jgi:hypothetical protein
MNMKINEVFERLMNNRDEVYEAIDEYGQKLELCISSRKYCRFQITSKNGTKIDPSLGGGGFSGNIKSDYDWYLVRKPVTFMKAINSGKRIRAENWANFHTWNEALDILRACANGQALGRINGKWLIE